MASFCRFANIVLRFPRSSLPGEPACRTRVSDIVHRIGLAIRNDCDRDLLMKQTQAARFPIVVLRVCDAWTRVVKVHSVGTLVEREACRSEWCIQYTTLKEQAKNTIINSGDFVEFRSFVCCFSDVMCDAFNLCV